ncbi:MAG: TlpA family protein disulfide reductase [Saprospiraceae bacterium]|jgi:cytochrome c biogenesis protein CcmG, thiol:disulfide interchange protein DsbE|nr:TlpA family protein disulfide reductase [Candidatus Defluviibacterium haderslevense]MBL0236113.1 TlpA family protein disulfide reductase [Candidatus Defluviibacterium haderslevense]MCI1265236.1 TlpA family protein disulfide reductase [Saprospiraceae bacterium]
MKKLLFLTFAVGLIAMSFTVLDKKFPALKLKNLDGKEVDLNASFSKNKLTVVSYWATWCSPCKKELDAMNELYSSWQKDGIEVIAITIDDIQQLNKVKPLAQQKKWKYTLLSDSNKESMRTLNFQSIPQTFVVDKNGNILYTHSGYVAGDEFELEKKLKSFLK